MLHAVINAKNETIVKEVAQIESARQGMLTQLGIMRKTSLNNEYLTATEQMVAKMQGDIDALLRQQAKHQNVFTQLMRETKATIFKKIKEVKDGVAIQVAKFDYLPEQSKLNMLFIQLMQLFCFQI